MRIRIRETQAYHPMYDVSRSILGRFQAVSHGFETNSDDEEQGSINGDILGERLLLQMRATSKKNL